MKIRRFQMKDMDQTIDLYQQCFAEAPWFEVFDPEELAQEFSEFLSFADAVFLVCEHEGKIVGGAVGFSVSRKADIVSIIPESFREGFYFSELFVDPLYRNHGIAKLLVQDRREAACAQGYRTGVVRTSVSQPITQHLYIDRLGFTIIATQEAYSTKLIDGVKQECPDTRVIMVGTM
ncbi:hypothetical protein A2318_03840 [Candidatus Uhrbacteria bacterium RIFOXYB2_FULL_45_11]|uniref:N-acetyltransferase domain-containing protein n=1 Tax=Candidatus Uhrbacteria bacterium RIFOXYB2_FULL_45_11 TaxID=1802421 RepID=A0A1F7W7C7_9BACT|nr:MAG: hypothetical protein A2318_03840 [Candidatus Uhrbacteria bacterium RIFOXYB2_FULL_45_11]